LLGSPGGALRSPAPVWQWCLVVAGMAAPLVIRRRWPRTVFAVVLATSVAAAFALYMVALTTPSKPGRRFNAPVVGALSATGIFLATVVGTPIPQARTIGSIVLGTALLGGAWTLGRAV